MPPRTPPQATETHTRLTIIAISAMLLPIVLFYGILARHVINMPYLDDYNGVLEYLEHFSSLPTTAAKLGSIVFTQHNEYKPMFANAVIALQYKLFGHPDFVILSWAGNLFILALFYLLWRDFLPHEQQLSQRLMLFVPVAYLLFQLQYAETLNWSMPGLQNVPVLIFALASIACLNQKGIWSFLLACLFLILTIAASGNGFVLFPVGIAMLWPRKVPARLATWLLVSGLCMAVYFYRYNLHSSQQEQNGGSVLHAAHSLNPIFALSFMGAAVGNGMHVVHYISIPLGLAITVVLALMAKRRYDKVNPVIFYYAAFLLLTAIAVSGIRSKLGIHASTAGRYKIYSDLLLICCYAFLIEMHANTSQLRRRYFQAALVVSILFCALFDFVGSRYLSRRVHDLKDGARLYQSSHHQQGPVEIDGDDKNPFALAVDQMAHNILEDADSTGLYRYP